MAQAVRGQATSHPIYSPGRLYLLEFSLWMHTGSFEEFIAHRAGVTRAMTR
jgi:hypothetical protein